jgi:hypothetical protein
MNHSSSFEGFITTYMEMGASSLKARDSGLSVLDAEREQRAQTRENEAPKIEAEKIAINQTLQLELEK